MRKPRSRPRRIPTNRPRIDCSGASSQLWLSKISTSERVEDLGTLRGDCGTAPRVVQGALKLHSGTDLQAAFQTGSYGYRPKRTAHPEPLSKSVGKRLAPRALTSNEACDHVGVADVSEYVSRLRSFSRSLVVPASTVHQFGQWLLKKSRSEACQFGKPFAAAFGGHCRPSAAT